MTTVFQTVVNDKGEKYVYPWTHHDGSPFYYVISYGAGKTPPA